VNYEEFRGKIMGFLRGRASGAEWREIRESLQHSQKVPNNRWVREMEANGGLLRTRREDGATIWWFDEIFERRADETGYFILTKGREQVS